MPLWCVTRVKIGKPYFTFSSPEASDLIYEYLKELHRDFPDYNPIPEDTLFRVRNKPINGRSLSMMFQRINERAGFEKRNGRFLIRQHSLRKVFASTLEKNKMPHLMTRWLIH